MARRLWNSMKEGELRPRGKVPDGMYQLRFVESLVDCVFILVGHSSFPNLYLNPVSVIKIDGSYVGDSSSFIFVIVKSFFMGASVPVLTST